MNTTVKYIICLQSVVRLEMLNRGNLEASVNLDGFHACGMMSQLVRDDAAPLAGQEQQRRRRQDR